MLQESSINEKGKNKDRVLNKRSNTTTTLLKRPSSTDEPVEDEGCWFEILSISKKGGSRKDPIFASKGGMTERFNVNKVSTSTRRRRDLRLADFFAFVNLLDSSLSFSTLQILVAPLTYFNLIRVSDILDRYGKGLNNSKRCL